MKDYGNFSNCDNLYDYIHDYRYLGDLAKQREKEGRVAVSCKKISDLKGLSPEDLLVRSGQKNTIPINLTEILNYAGISALPINFESLADSLETEEAIDTKKILGACIANGENVAIFYRETDAKDSHRYRFTIAHELAHCCLTGDTSHIEFRTDSIPSDNISDVEYKANAFAGKLLIPKDQFYSVLNQLYIPSVQVLSSIFQVSEKVMIERIKCINPKELIAGYNY